MMNPSEPCPCGSGRSYQECCEPLHLGQARAKTAEQLMRSRYAAFSKGLVEYLLETLHPSIQTENTRLSLLNTINTCQWLKLDLLDTIAGTAEDNSGFVEFVAYFKEKKVSAMREKSRFIKEKGIWFYVDGDAKKAGATWQKRALLVWKR